MDNFLSKNRTKYRTSYDDPPYNEDNERKVMDPDQDLDGEVFLLSDEEILSQLEDEASNIDAITQSYRDGYS